MYTVTIVGVGRIGGALVLSLPRSKYMIDNVIVRNRDQWLRASRLPLDAIPVVDVSDITKIGSRIVLISTQDAEIPTVAARLAGHVMPGTTVLHTSGSLSSAVLEPMAMAGCQTGSLHPLVSVSEPTLGPERFAGAYFCLEGDPAAVELAREIVTDLGGVPFFINTDKKALYHAAAVMACGHLVALIDASIEVMTKCGVDARFAKQILMPLVDSTVRNLETQDPFEALTGTFARGDLETFERHLAALSADDSRQLRDIYLTLGERSLDIALKSGINEESVTAIRNRIFMAKSNIR